ncbi:MAG TPA: alpha/beta hydrolase [Thermoanaerobaculia bacterium]|nr:alpha/beta hydrolase [Thermoanaerobaculia bacterium]
MKDVRAIVASLAVIGALGAAVPGLAAKPPHRPELTPCRKPGIPAGARCGTYEVFENRAARTGRKIPLRIVVLPATGPDRLPDPFVYFAGGPGDASIPEGLAMARDLPSLRRKRDVLLVDLRGTGESGGLFCTELSGKEGIQGFLDDFLPTDKIRACRDRLKKKVDLSWYTTDAAVDDVEEVRTALGYGKLNLMGVSYGTHAVLTYLQRHPRSVRTATLESIMAPNAQYPLGLARATQEALEGLIAECAGDPVCHGAFPKLREEVETVLGRATAEPVRVKLAGMPAGQPSELRLTHTGVAQTLRYMLYSPADAALLPLAVHLAAQGDWKPLAQKARFFASFTASSAVGFYQSVTCAEDVAFIRDEEVAPAVAGTFLGDFRVRRQKAACAGWPTRNLGPDLRTPVISDVPSLLISGERDPATPAADGERVARTLKRARHLVIADAGHGPEGMKGEGCLSRLVDAFIEAGAPESLDSSCVAGMRRPDFVLRLSSPEVKIDPEVLVAQAELERLPGSYASEEMGLAVKVELLKSHLRISVTQGPPFPPSLLIPTSPTRFRWEGKEMAPGLTVVFQVVGGKATALTVIQPGKPELVMKRSQ